MMTRSFTLLFAAALPLAVGCAKKPAAPAPSPELTSARVRSHVKVAPDLALACSLKFADVAQAPKFDYDDDRLLESDKAVLEQIAKCVTTGPLAGRELSLVGRADPRGETEYNMVLGGYRADSVREYLELLGVGSKKIAQTSRGELDAEGKDETGWSVDRRVDIALK